MIGSPFFSDMGLIMENPVILSINDNELTNNDVIIHLKATGRYKEAIQELIKVKAYENFAKENNIEVGDDELQEFVNETRKNMRLFVQADIQKYLGNLGITTDQWIDSLELDLLKNKIKDTVLTEEKLDQYFKENKLQFVKVELYKIPVETKGAAEEVIMEARDDHDNFSSIAMKVSIDNSLKASGGYLGPVARGALPVEIESKAFTSSEGDIIGPFKEGEIYTVYKIGSIIQPEYTDDFKNNLKNKLFDMWSGQLIQSQRIKMPEQ